MAKQIKFSHRYGKLNGVSDGGQAMLLDALKIHYNDLSKYMIGFDTHYHDDKGNLQYYPLPKTDLILLIFSEFDSRAIFFTMRRWTDGKFDYYKKSVGEMFKVVIEE